MRKNNQTGFKKIQFIFSAKTVEVIDWLKKISHAASWAEVVRNAIYVYNYFVNAIRNGWEIYHIDKDGHATQVILPNIHGQQESEK